MAWTSLYALQNEKGARFDLTAPASVYLVDVQGLGIATDRSFGSIGNGFFLLTSDEVPTNPITGDLIFQYGAFGTYESLINWISKAKTIYFCYSPLDVEYVCRVRLNYIRKGQRDSAGWMRGAISFYPLSPFYRLIDSEVTIETGGPNSKAYLEHDGEYYYTYDDDLVYGPEISGDLAKQIVPEGTEPSGFLLRYTGAIDNPVITLTGESGKVYGECHITQSFSAGDTLELCTAIDNSYVHMTHDGIVTDLMAESKVDLAYDPYPRAPVDEPSILRIEADDDVTGSAELIVYRYYRSV